MKRSNSATLWFLEEKESERKKLENKTVFESKILTRVCLATNFFRTRNFLNGDFYNSPDFKSKYILRVEYWIEFQHSVEIWSTIFTLHQISKKKLFLELQSCCINSISKILYLVNFHRKNVKFSFFCAFLQKLFWKKAFY